jgi:hypothetical protein
MSVKLVSLAALASAALSIGCHTLPPGAEPGPDGTMAYNVTIEASEPGATIKANGQDIGKTPLTLKIYGDTDGTFHDFGSYFYVIQAIPVASNQYAQTRVYRTGHLFTPEDMVPHSIFFDMSKPAPTPPAVTVPGAYYGPQIWIGPPPGPYGPAFYGPGPYWRRHW